ncbi:unnamed protein product, partial [Didymodactylos carnosus]
SPHAYNRTYQHAQQLGRRFLSVTTLKLQTMDDELKKWRIPFMLSTIENSIVASNLKCVSLETVLSANFLLKLLEKAPNVKILKILNDTTDILRNSQLCAIINQQVKELSFSSTVYLRHRHVKEFCSLLVNIEYLRIKFEKVNNLRKSLTRFMEKMTALRFLKIYKFESDQYDKKLMTFFNQSEQQYILDNEHKYSLSVWVK